MNTPTEQGSARAWREYDAAANDLARRGLKGEIGDRLPNLMSLESVQLISDAPDAFKERVRLSAYALAMGCKRCGRELAEAQSNYCFDCLVHVMAKGQP